MKSRRLMLMIGVLFVMVLAAACVPTFGDSEDMGTAAGILARSRRLRATLDRLLVASPEAAEPPPEAVTIKVSGR